MKNFFLDSLVTPKIDTITDTNSSIIEKDLIHEIPGNIIYLHHI